jgi:hypothetical protein
LLFPGDEVQLTIQSNSNKAQFLPSGASKQQFLARVVGAGPEVSSSASTSILAVTTPRPFSVWSTS